MTIDDDHPLYHDRDDEEREQDEPWLLEGAAAAFRGVAVAARKAALATRKAAAAKSAGSKRVVRAVGENRALAFSSEGAVAGEKVLPRVLYYGAWTLSGAAIAADVYTKREDAPEELRFHTALYWTAFHVPASLVVPAVIIHRIVHAVERALEHPPGSMTKAIATMSPRAKALAPVGAALFSIVPVVPAVDYLAEAIMEPTLGAYLGLTFHHHHHHHHHQQQQQQRHGGEGHEHEKKE